MTDPQKSNSRLQIILSHFISNPRINPNHSNVLNVFTSGESFPLSANGKPLNRYLIEDLNSVLELGKQKEKKAFYEKFFNKDSLFVKHYDVFDLTTKQKKFLTTKKFIQLMKDLDSIGWSNHEQIDWYVEYISLTDPSLITLFGAHYVLFTGAIDKQAHDELREKYLQKARSLEILGCYCMTEIAHGSYIRGMQTIADYDPEREEFIIDTPGPNAMKFWIGNAGFDATHGIVFARLRTKGHDYGIHLFLVPLRNMEDHTPLPGIQIGDIGEKQGRNGISNGYVLFKNVRIPRGNMLMRWSVVTKEGDYIPSPNPALSYGALIEGRTRICVTSSLEMKRAITIGIRYAHARRQFHNKVSHDQDPKEETLLINYQSHQATLLPHLANTYAQNFACHEIVKRYRSLIEDMDQAKKNNTSFDKQLLSDVHNLSSGMKAIFSEQAAKTLLECRQSLGGHGYSAYSGFPLYYNDFIASNTFEGDNNVLLQQTARQLLKTFVKAQKGAEIKGMLQFLSNSKQILSDKCEVIEFAEFFDPSLLIRALEYRCVKSISDCATQMKEYIATTNSESIAWNRSQVNLINAAHNFIELFAGKIFLECIEKIVKPQTKTVLTSLFILYALHKLHNDISTLISDEGFINSKQISLIKTAFFHVCEEVKADSLNLCEAFDITDDVMPPLGKKDCKIYENLFARVQSNPEHNQKAPYYEELIKPLMKRNSK